MQDDRRLFGLVSSSSAAVEFNRQGFVERAKACPDDEIEILDPERTRERGIRAMIRLRDANGDFSFVHAGFQVNFDGEMECIPMRFIQATHVLLYAAGYQALCSDGAGMVEIDRDDDEWILHEACKHI
ncbi:MAG: hypothetical protein OEU36_02705 [Gammaproteobacteria bacterium]|jgi:hypothetical protein|nr:hypothetical protein [Gammaproteobacteria bacterium]